MCSNHRHKITFQGLVYTRLLYDFRSTIFFKFGFLGQSSGRRVIKSVISKKKLKKTKYWRRNVFKAQICYFVFSLTAIFLAI